YVDVRKLRLDPATSRHQYVRLCSDEGSTEPLRACLAQHFQPEVGPSNARRAYALQSHCDDNARAIRIAQGGAPDRSLEVGVMCTSDHFFGIDGDCESADTVAHIR